MASAGERIAEQLRVALSGRDVDGLATLATPGVVGHDVSEATPRHGRDGVRQALARYLDAFPDLQIVNDGAVIADDAVALNWVARGTHRGAFLNIPPTGRTVEVQGVALLAVEGGRVAQWSLVWDVAGLLRGLGLLPELAADRPVGEATRGR